MSDSPIDEIADLRGQLAEAQRERDDWQRRWKQSEVDNGHAIGAAKLRAESELARAVDARTHTQDWYARHYGKLEDWARKRLPDPWANEFFHCVANGTWGHDDVGEPYMSQVGKIVPSGYFKMDTAAEQLLRDQTKRAEDAESRLELAEQSRKRKKAKK